VQAERRRLAGLGLAGGLGWAALSALPYLQAALLPPAGRRFGGFLYYQDDQYLYLSFAEQAMRGAFLLENKFDLVAHPPFLINLGWWLAGRLGAVLGGTVPGTHALGVLATVLLAHAAGGLLQRGGCPRPAWGLALFATAGGLGFVQAARGAPFESALDLATGLFPPGVRLLGVAQHVLGSALWLVSLLWHLEWRAGRRGRAWWVLSAAALGLVRPYDLVPLALSAAGLLVWDRSQGMPLRAVAARAAEWLWLAPVFFYVALAFVAHPSFAAYSQAPNRIALLSLAPFVWAVGPAAVLAGYGLWRRARRGPASDGAPEADGDAPDREREVRLALWCAAGGVPLLLALPFSFGFQFTGALGAALLLLAALGLPGRGLPAATLALCPTTLVLLWRLLNPRPEWFPPRGVAEVADFLKRECRPRERVLAPEALALLAAGTGPCGAVIGHRVLTPDFERRIDESNRFYAPSTDPAWRRGYLRQVGADWLVLGSGFGAAALGLPADAAPALAAQGLEVWRVTDRAPASP
jgi:hypothetical protein